MPTGTITEIVHLAQQTPLDNARLVHDQVRYELQPGSDVRAKRVTPIQKDAEPGREGVKNPPPREEQS